MDIGYSPLFCLTFRTRRQIGNLNSKYSTIKCQPNEKYQLCLQATKSTIILLSSQKLFKNYLVIVCSTENESELNAKAFI